MDKYTHHKTRFKLTSDSHLGRRRNIFLLYSSDRNIGKFYFEEVGRQLNATGEVTEEISRRISTKTVHEKSSVKEHYALTIYLKKKKNSRRISQCSPNFQLYVVWV